MEWLLDIILNIWLNLTRGEPRNRDEAPGDQEEQQ
jgi:hypothetical protein